MAVLPILQHPDPRLRRKALPITTFDAALQTFIDDLFETMYAAPGVGLAATQVGDLRRVAVMDCAREGQPPQPLVMINPVIESAAEKALMDEGCLSVAGVSERVERHTRLRLKALDRHGAPYELEAEGLLAQAIQHEIDHLDGKLYLDRLSSLKRERLLKKLAKIRDVA